MKLTLVSKIFEFKLFGEVRSKPASSRCYVDVQAFPILALRQVCWRAYALNDEKLGADSHPLL